MFKQVLEHQTSKESTKEKGGLMTFLSNLAYSMLCFLLFFSSLISVLFDLLMLTEKLLVNLNLIFWKLFLI